jgi:hypothetical protein
MNNQIPADNKEIFKELGNFRSNLQAVESHIYVTIPVVYKVVSNKRKRSSRCEIRTEPIYIFLFRS